MVLPHAVNELLVITVVGTAVYAGVLVLYVIVMLGLAFWESRLRRRQSDLEDYESVRGSRYSIPVSVIAPTFNEEVMAVPAVRSLLAMSYPEFEVIVVDDGSSDGTIAALDREFDLEARQVFFRDSLAAKPVRTVYRSRSDPRLTVVSKENGGKADALNCGINFARYRYLCCVDGDTVFAPDALLKAMALVATDPARIVAAASLFGISLEPEATRDLARVRPRMNEHLLGDFQHLDLMRSFVAYRLAWSRLDCMLCVSGAFGIWRRDVILEMGGFSSQFTCEDIEMTFRIHERFLRERRPYRILSLPHMVAQTEGPSSVRSLISQRARWQRVTLETIWHYRAMCGRARYRTAGLIGLPYYLLFECLAPVFQLVSFVVLGVAIAFGVLGWQAYLAFLGLTVFGTAIPTTVAVALHDAAFRDYRMRDLIRMLVLGPLDLLLYRPILIYAGLRGCWEFLRREKGWNKFDRNARHTATTTTIAASALLLLFASRARAQVVDTVAEASHLAQTGHAARAVDLLDARLAGHPDDVDALVTLANALRQLNRRPQALRVIERAYALAPNRSDVVQLRAQLRQDVTGTDVTVADSYQHWGDDRDPWRQEQITVRQGAPAGSGIVQISRATEFGLHDEDVDAQAYPMIGRGYAALSAGYSPDATLYPRSSFAGEFFGAFSGAREASLGYTRLDFADPVNLWTASGGLYRGNYYFVARVTDVTGGASGPSLTLSSRRYLSDGEQYVGLQASAGSVRTNILVQPDIAALATASLAGDAVLIWHEREVLTLHAEAGRQATSGASGVNWLLGTIGLGVRF